MEMKILKIENEYKKQQEVMQKQIIALSTDLDQVNEAL